MAVPSAVAGLLRRPARLGDEVYSAIFSAIMALEIAPGDRISIDALARQLGVSSTPVREALARLESEGLVCKTHLIGYSSAPRMSALEFDELCEVRLLLEPYAAGRAARLMSMEAIEHLAALCGEMEALVEAEAPMVMAHFAQLDMAFHDQIAANSGNGRLTEALTALRTHVHLFRLGPGNSSAMAAAGEHYRIITAIRARNGDAAAVAMRSHIESSRQRLSAAWS